MPTLFIPTPLRDLVDGQISISVDDASNVDEALEILERLYPGVQNRLVEIKEGRRVLRVGLQVAVDGVFAAKGLRQSVKPDSEIHFLPAIGGGH